MRNIKIWDGGMIPYLVDTAFDKNLQSDLQEAISQVESSTCVKFVPYVSQEYYIYIKSSDQFAYAPVGKPSKPGKSEVNIPKNYNAAVTMHLILHVVGLVHEDTRPDSGHRLVYYRENIKPGKRYYFVNAQA
ncbi:unnamed protein product [Soboliphyme baturini]|uniref:Metalloendopeptidase n=1 Tax=Soboliphyme baturini TaxID=241478 RepID=A0A183IX82_9BILA|nr:unnamed protein product [Soboliphyme baturini]